MCTFSYINRHLTLSLMFVDKKENYRLPRIFNYLYSSRTSTKIINKHQQWHHLLLHLKYEQKELVHNFLVKFNVPRLGKNQRTKERRMSDEVDYKNSYHPGKCIMIAELLYLPNIGFNQKYQNFMKIGINQWLQAKSGKSVYCSHIYLNRFSSESVEEPLVIQDTPKHRFTVEVTLVTKLSTNRQKDRKNVNLRVSIFSFKALQRISQSHNTNNTVVDLWLIL